MASISWYRSQINSLKVQIKAEEALLERLNEDKEKLKLAEEGIVSAESGVRGAKADFLVGNDKLSKSFSGDRANGHKVVNGQLLKAYEVFISSLSATMGEVYKARDDVNKKEIAALQRISDMKSEIRYYERCIIDLENESDKKMKMVKK